MSRVVAVTPQPHQLVDHVEQRPQFSQRPHDGGVRGNEGQGEVFGEWVCAPRGVQGQSPWSGGLGAKPPEAGSFCCISSLFLSILEGIVEL